MANQQLVDYVKQQLQLGVSKEAVKAALVQAGWPEAEINDALSAASPAPAQPAPSQPQPAVSLKPAQPSPAAAATPAAATPAGSPAAGPSSPAAQKPISGPQFVTRDIFQPKSEPVFQSKIQAMPAAVTTGEVKRSSARKYIVAAVVGIIIAGLAGASVYFYSRNTSLIAQLNLGGASTSALEEANSRIASLTADNNSLNTQIVSLNQEKSDLVLHLSFFLPPLAGTSTPADITIGGTLGGGGKNPYTLTTARKAVLTIKNSKDQNVVDAFKNLVGGTVEISGTYLPGTRDVTVVKVNGAAVNVAAPAPAATSTSTTTPPAP